MASNKQSASFLPTWSAALGIRENEWRDVVGARLNERPFADPDALMPYFEALFTEVPHILDRRPSELIREVADAYGRFCLAIWHSESLYPAYSENYADFLLNALRQDDALPSAAIALADIYRPNAKRSGQCGFNQIVPSQPDPIYESERILVSGNHEFFLTDRGLTKYDEYLTVLNSSEIFRKDWQAIAATFPEECQAGILRRSLIPERNWNRGDGARFDNPENTFQAVFDVFCWKWFLYGMADGEPLLQKPSVNVTPMGTQIFIPGYMSLDPKRDLNFSEINKLHRARGIRNQGKAFKQARQQRRELAKAAQAALESGRARGLKGDRLYSFIAETVGRPDADPATVRRWIKTEPK